MAIKLANRSQMGVVVHVADKTGHSEFGVFQLYCQHVGYSNPNLAAQRLYEHYCEGGDISENMTDFCVLIMVGRITVPQKARSRRDIA